MTYASEPLGSIFDHNRKWNGNQKWFSNKVDIFIGNEMYTHRFRSRQLGIGDRVSRRTEETERKGKWKKKNKTVLKSTHRKFAHNGVEIWRLFAALTWCSQIGLVAWIKVTLKSHFDLYQAFWSRERREKSTHVMFEYFNFSVRRWICIERTTEQSEESKKLIVRLVTVIIGYFEA